IRPVLIERTPSRIDAIRAYRRRPVGDFTSRRVPVGFWRMIVVWIQECVLLSPSARVVYAALAGDLAVAAAKFGASALSGSSAMLTEAIHSLVDSADQLLLLTGQSRARKSPDRTHPLGYGMETYFWSFVVALFVFFLGGLVAFYQGVRHI